MEYTNSNPNCILSSYRNFSIDLFQWRWKSIINTFEWNDVELLISMEIYIYLGIYANSIPTIGYFPIRGSNNTISLIDPYSNIVTHSEHGFKHFMLGK